MLISCLQKKETQKTLLQSKNVGQQHKNKQPPGKLQFIFSIIITLTAILKRAYQKKTYGKVGNDFVYKIIDFRCCIFVHM